jgi:hypothetical protein
VAQQVRTVLLAGDFLLVPPGWSGEPLEDATVIHVPTTIATVVGRWGLLGRERPARPRMVRLWPICPDQVPNR